MTSVEFASWSPNREDVVLNRVFAAVADGHAVELRSGPAAAASATTALTARGWLVDSRTDVSVERLGPQLATIDTTRPLHLLVLDDARLTHPAVAALATLELRPWVVLSPAMAQVEAAGYRRTLYDGVNDFLLAEEHAELTDALSYPACSRDTFSGPVERALRADLLAARKDVERWRTSALEGWTIRVLSQGGSAQQQLEAMRQTLSWRVTRPLRVARVLRERMSPGWPG